MWRTRCAASQLDPIRPSCSATRTCARPSEWWPSAHSFRTIMPNPLCSRRWIAEEWSSCSTSCGSGMRTRTVVCAEEANGIKHNVSAGRPETRRSNYRLSGFNNFHALAPYQIPDDACRSKKPPLIEECKEMECPKWVLRSDWSGVSFSQPHGYKVQNDGRARISCTPTPFQP